MRVDSSSNSTQRSSLIIERLRNENEDTRLKVKDILAPNLDMIQILIE